MRRFDFLTHAMGGHALSKNINRDPAARCFYAECGGRLELATRTYSNKIAGVEFKFDIKTPQCVKCEQFIISEELQYAELLSARQYLLRPIPLTNEGAHAIRRIIGGTREDFARVLDQTVEEIALLETGALIPQHYGYTLLGIITQEISIMES
jgi:DNA-binding transcriptional regulator YiaG